MSKGQEIANLRHQLALQSYIDASDGAGGFERQWQTIASIWAQIMPGAPQPRFEAARQQAIVNHRIMIRWRPDVTAAMRLTDGTVFYRINGAHDADGKRAYLVCYCEQVVS
jgi:SPP1 family predicted phage head-tail adaptor